jgi:hypothetical protein
MSIILGLAVTLWSAQKEGAVVYKEEFRHANLREDIGTYGVYFAYVYMCMYRYAMGIIISSHRDI